MKKLFAFLLCLILVTGNLAVFSSAEEVQPASGTADFGTIEVEPSDDAAAYYQQLLDAEKYNYRILRYIPAAFDADSASQAIRGNRLGEKQQKLLDETVEIRQNMKRVRSAEDTMWMLWPASMPMSEGNIDLNFDSAVDNPGFRPYLTPYLLDDQSAVKANLIVIAGGGYSGRNNWTEGFPIVDRFNALGYNCFLLQRRVAPYSVEDIWMDMQRSIRLVKHKVEELNLGGADCIAAAGFSGGSATMLGSVAKYYGDIQPGDTDPSYIPDEIDAYNADLDIALCIYGPNYASQQPYEGLITDNENLPAMFIVAGLNDNTGAQFDNLILVDSVKDKTMVEYHAFANVPHGFGITYEGTNAQYWPLMADCFIDQAIAAKNSAE